MVAYAIRLVTPPAEEPVSLPEAKRQCGVMQDGTYHDNLLQGLISTARQTVEIDTGRAIVNQTWELTLDRFPVSREPIVIPKSPLVSVESIKYLDTEGVEQTLATSVYKVLTGREPGEIRLKFNQSWPMTYSEPGGIVVLVVVGYGGSVPAGIKQAMLLLIAHWFEHRSAVITGTIQAQLSLTYKALITNHLVGDEFTVYGR